MIGRVKWWSFDKGYGFIECNEDDNIFVHVKDSEVLETNFKENEMITFEKAVITVTERPITIAGSNCEVTAKAEQIPNT